MAGHIQACWWDGSQISQTLDAVLQKGQTMPEKNRFPAVLVPAIAFSCKDHGADAGDVAPTLRAMGHGETHANAGGQVAVAFVQNSRDEVRLMGGDGDVVGALSAQPGAKQQCYVAFHPLQDPISSTDGTTHAVGCGSSSGQASVAVAYTTKLHNTKSNNAGKIFEERTPALTAGSPPPALMTAMQVRRLIPRECERLQGMPDDHTLVPVPKGNPKAIAKLPGSMGVFETMADAMEELRGTSVEEARFAVKCGDGVAQVYKLAADGPRYKAIGNSWAVLCVRWILDRIAAEVARLEAQAGCA